MADDTIFNSSLWDRPGPEVTDLLCGSADPAGSEQCVSKITWRLSLGAKWEVQKDR